MDAESLALLVAFPFAFDGELNDGSEMKQLPFCRRCESKDCMQFRGMKWQHYTCSKGFSCYPFSFDGLEFVVNDLVATEHNRSFTGERRKAYRINAVSETSVGLMRERLNRIAQFLTVERKEAARDSVGYLHDIRTSVGIVLSCAQELIDEKPGSSFGEKLNNADLFTFNLFQAISLLEEQLKLADVFASPETITFGPRFNSSLYGLLHKLVKLFQPRAEDRDVRLEIHGSSYKSVMIYNSFQFIPLILLDNALKYSFKQRTILVYLQDLTEGVKVAFSSYGYVVPESEKNQIFEKYYRSTTARRVSASGMGLGLYLAKLIADAHGFTINYEAPYSDASGIGTNAFWFVVPHTAL